MANEDDKHPKQEFNEVSQPSEIEVIFEADFDDELQDDIDEPLRGNADPRLEPDQKNRMEFTPSGTSAPRYGQSRQTDRQTQRSDQEQAYVQADTPMPPEQQRDLLNGNHTFEQEFNGLNVRTWMADQPGKGGIHEGRIREMVVTKGDKGQEIVLARFENGEWKKRPEATQERQSIADAVHEYDPDCLKTKSKTNDPDNNHENEKDKGRTR